MGAKNIIYSTDVLTGLGIVL